jgi:hypothetical protein
MSMDTKTSARICVNFVLDSSDSCYFPYETDIKAMITKIPGFTFGSFRQVVFAASIITSETAYNRVLKDLLNQSSTLP